MGQKKDSPVLKDRLCWFILCVRENHALTCWIRKIFIDDSSLFVLLLISVFLIRLITAQATMKNKNNVAILLNPALLQGEMEEIEL